MKRYVIILALLAVSAVVAVAATGGGGSPQETPFDSGQSSFGVDGPDGQPVICSNGKELRVSKDSLKAKPPKPHTKEAKDEMEGKVKVWRCGTGKDPDKHPRLIDKVDDPLANPAA